MYIYIPCVQNIFCQLITFNNATVKQFYGSVNAFVKYLPILTHSRYINNVFVNINDYEMIFTYQIQYDTKLQKLIDKIVLSWVSYGVYLSIRFRYFCFFTILVILDKRYLYTQAFWRLTQSVTIVFTSNKLMSSLYANLKLHL